MNLIEQLIAMMQELMYSLPFVSGQYSGDDDIDNETFGSGHGKPRRRSRRRRSAPTGGGGGGSGTGHKPRRLPSAGPSGGGHSIMDHTKGGGVGVPSPSPSRGSGLGIADVTPDSARPNTPNLPNYNTGVPAKSASKPASGGGWRLPGLGLGSSNVAKGGDTGLSFSPKPSASGSSLDSMLGKAGFTKDQIPTMKGIIQAESGGNPNATNRNTNGTIDRGLAQINSVHKQFDAGKLLSDPQYNLNAAHQVYQQQGYKAWSTYNSGAAQKAMGVANKAYSTPLPAPVAHPGTSATHVPIKAAVANRGHATTKPATPGTAQSAARTPKPAHATAKATGGTQAAASHGAKAGHAAKKKTTKKTGTKKK